MVIGSIVLGLLIGSFLTVCIYRIPYGREKGPPRWDEEEASDSQDAQDADGAAAGEPNLSIFSPVRSFCPHCTKQLLWWHNIPLFSWLLLGGKCWFCKERISVRYPLVELLTALFCFLSYSMYGLSLTALLVFLISAALIVISFIDLDYYIIPDVISLPGIALGLAAGLVNNYFQLFSWPIVSGWPSSLLGLLIGGGTLFIISEIYLRLRKRIGLGLGDVKLLAMTGAFLGVRGALYGMFIGSLVGSVIGIVFILIFRKKFTYQLPFGPCLAAGTLIYMFAADPAGWPGSGWLF